MFNMSKNYNNAVNRARLTALVGTQLAPQEIKDFYGKKMVEQKKRSRASSFEIKI